MPEVPYEYSINGMNIRIWSISTAGSILKLITSWIKLFLPLLIRNFVAFPPLLLGKYNAWTGGIDSGLQIIYHKVLNATSKGVRGPV